jgi:response regulator RpfG family c-di-GMP phosphodiesterase
MGTPLSVLIVEDSASDTGLMVRQLQKEGFDVRHTRVETAEQMRAALGESAWGLVLSDFKVPGFGAAPALALLHESGLDLPFILISGTIGEETAVGLMKAGAHDYVMKDHLGRLGAVVRRELAEAAERSGRQRAESALRESDIQLKGILESTADGILAVDGKGKVIRANRRFAELWRIPKPLLDSGDDQAMLDFALGQLNDAEAFVNKVRALYASAAEATDTLSFKDGRTFERHSSPLVLDGTVLGRVWSFRDITEKKRAEEEIRRYVEQLKKALASTVEVATLISEMRDPYTAGHERRVAQIAVAIGAELGFDARRQEGLKVAGHLHDIGKITIPSEILSKPGKLSAIQFQLVQGHARAGYDVLKGVEFPWPVAEVALQHHERIDGSGYPQGLKGKAILLEARIIAVADVIEAMSSHRPYRPGLGIDQALAEVERGRATVYDTDAADACLRLFREGRYQLPA